MDLTDIEGITRDDLNAENKNLRRSIYIEFTNTYSFGKLFDHFFERFEQYLIENLLPMNFESDILDNCFKEDKVPWESLPEHYTPEFVYYPCQRATFRPRHNMRIADILKRKRPPRRKREPYWPYRFLPRSDTFSSYSPSTSDSDLDGRAAVEKLKSDIMELMISVRKTKLQLTLMQPVDKKDQEVVCSSPPSSALLPSPSSLTVADQLEQIRTLDSDLEGGDTARVVSQDSSDLSDSFFEVRKMSSTSVPVDTEDVCSSQVRKKRYQHKSFRTRKVPNTLKASSTSGSDFSDNTREAQARERWDRGHRKPCYAHVKVLIFVSKSVCEKLAKYLGLIYIEGILTEARTNMLKFNISKRDNLKSCPFIQPYITKKRILGYHHICLTHTKYLWHTIYADYKAVISNSDDESFYSELKEDANCYVEMGTNPHFLVYLEAVTVIVNKSLDIDYDVIARYRCKNGEGEDCFHPIRLSLIAIIPFSILGRIIGWDWDSVIEESNDS